MTHTTEPPQPDPETQPESERATRDTPAAQAAAFRRLRGATSALKAAAADDPLTAIFGPMIVLLLGYSLYTSNDRFGEMNDRFIALEDSIDRRFAHVDARFTQIEARFTQIEARLGA